MPAGCPGGHSALSLFLPEQARQQAGQPQARGSQQDCSGEHGQQPYRRTRAHQQKYPQARARGQCQRQQRYGNPRKPAYELALYQAAPYPNQPQACQNSIEPAETMLITAPSTKQAANTASDTSARRRALRAAAAPRRGTAGSAGSTARPRAACA